MQKHVISKILTVVFVCVLFVVPVFAESGSGSSGNIGSSGDGDVRKELKDIKDEAREKKKDVLGEAKEKRQELRDQVKEKKEEFKTKFGRAAIGTATLKSISGTTLGVEKDEKSYTVLTGTFDHCTTKFRRKFWGDSSIAEMSIGDQLNVVGKWQDQAKSTIEACIVRNTSIQKRFAVFVGDVVSLSGNGFVMSTVSASRQNQTVTLESGAKLVDRRGQTVIFSQIAVGHRVRVKGLWNRTVNTVQVQEVKDFSLPFRVSVSPGITPVVTVSPTVTTTVSPTITP